MLQLTSQRRAGRHATGDELVAYCLGRLEREKAYRLQGHLVVCRDCRNLILDIAEYPDLSLPDGAMPKISNREVNGAFEATWEKLAEELPEGEERPRGFTSKQN